jgi:hypothetical protein
VTPASAVKYADLQAPHSEEKKKTPPAWKNGQKSAGQLAPFSEGRMAGKIWGVATTFRTNHLAAISVHGEDVWAFHF